MTCSSDVLIIGGGPAGLSAAINCASGGLSVRLLDAGVSLGGQAKESSAIENYPGFPESITGHDLMTRLVMQARKFNTKFVSPVDVVEIRAFNKNNGFEVMTSDYQSFAARAIILAIGVQYRRLQADDISSVIGRGVHYGMPAGHVPRNKACNIAVVGGANSAGQAVTHLALNTKAKIRLLIRKTIGHQMDTYLINRIGGLSNVEVCEGCEVVAVYSDRTGQLKSVDLRYADGTIRNQSLDHMFIFIGANPRTYWLKGVVELDPKNYVKTNARFETNVPGIFAVGDCNSDNVKRIAAASGEGSMCTSQIHKYLSQIN